jgi:uncharacterized protein (UPF0262 family)
MPPRKRPPIIVDIVTKNKPNPLKPPAKAPKRETLERLERHLSYNISGESSSSFIPIPPSPPRGTCQVLQEVVEPSVPSTPIVSLTEDDIERVDDETRLLEIEGLGHLSNNLSMQVSSDYDDNNHKRKRTEAVSFQFLQLTDEN